MSFLGWLITQSGKPTGLPGRVNLWRMSRRHGRLTEWGLGHVSVRSHDTVLDVGCGGGKAIARLAEMAREGKICGIDYSVASVAAARRTNRQGIASGRVEILLGSVARLPFRERMFDLVTAVETHYYWPDLNANVQEILRVMKPGGTFLLIAEAYRGGKYDQVLQRLEKPRGLMNYAILRASEHCDLLSNAGYSDVRVFEEYDKGWICALGHKP